MDQDNSKRINQTQYSQLFNVPTINSEPVFTDNRSEYFYLNRPANSYTDELKIYLEEKANHVNDSPLPFTQVEGKWSGKNYDFEFRKHELTVLGGSNGSGKSMLAGQIALTFMAYCKRCFIASFEMNPLHTLERMVRQLRCTQDKQFIDEYDVDLFMKIVGRNLNVYSKENATSIPELKQILISAIVEHGCEFLFVDSLMMCVRDDTDKAETDLLMQMLIEVVKTYPVHIVLIAHFRKASNSQNTKFDLFDLADKDNIKGSGTITNLAFNVLNLVKNTKKIKDKATKLDVDDNEPDHVLHVCKQRNGSYQGYIKLWFDPISLNFCNTPMRISETQKELRKVSGEALPF